MSRYIRFRVQRKDERSGSPEGLFTVAYREAEDRTLYDYEREWLHDLLRWFTKNLETPEVLRVRKNNGAVCWFIDAPSGVMDKARELITFLETRGYLIELDHTTRPGSIVYQDPYQIAAKPFRSEVTRRVSARSSKVPRTA